MCWTEPGHGANGRAHPDLSEHADTLISMPLTILLNGQQMSLSSDKDWTVAQLVAEKGFQADRIAIERNGSILPRIEWGETSLHEGDRLELVHFVGGGAPVS